LPSTRPTTQEPSTPEEIHDGPEPGWKGRPGQASIPFGRITQPQEVAALVTFLASDVAASVHGAHVPIDGAQRKALMER
jgi:NAD(P)-dependent dehydrogenase (short-subunit alcohol dehydrogenase family)